jgi:hypothetical protein
MVSHFLFRNSPTVMTSVELSVVEQASKPMILDDEGVQVQKDSDDISADSHTSLSCNNKH